MPVTSHQVGGLIGGQQAMFGNFASYSQQISPYGGGGPVPTYSNPMAGMGESMMPPPAPHAEFSQMAERWGTGAVGMMGHIPSAIGTMGMVGSLGGMMGSRALGAVGSAAGVFDPFSAGLGGLARGVGWQSGAGVGANLGRLGSLGIGGMARAGMAGLGGAAVAAAPAYLLTKGVEYAAGQMVQGAQYQGQVNQVLQNQFRFTNPQGTGGYGFSSQDRLGIGSMMREMGHKEMMSTPSEMLRVLQQGAGMGMFKAVSDAKEFKKKFTEMVGTLKEVAQTMNTSLEGAVPFLAQARQQGFWTPQDVMRNAQQAKATAAVTGMSVAQVQGMMGQGAQMARAIGAEGRTGARGMAKTMGMVGAMVGGPGRRGAWSEEEVGEVTGGMQGAEATAAISQTLQAATTHFARGTHARWTLAALGGKGFKNLDPEALRRFTEGRMGIGEIGGRARGNIGRQGAANFVMNEERLRGELLEQGPEAQLGFVKAIVGERRIHGEGAMDQYITRRLMKRYFGVGSKQADMLAKMAREAPRAMRDMQSRSALDLDQQERQQEEQLSRSWDGVKRQMSKWWDANVKEPLQKAGAEMAHSAAEWFERVSDKVWGRTEERHRFRGVRGAARRAFITGDDQEFARQFGTAAEAKALTGGVGELGPTVTGGVMDQFRGKGGWGVAEAAARMAPGWGLAAAAMPMRFTNQRIEALKELGVQGRQMTMETWQQQARTGKWLQGDVQMGMLPGQGGAIVSAMDREQVERTLSGFRAAATGKLDEKSAEALGFKSAEIGRAQMMEAQKLMGAPEYAFAAAKLKDQGLKGMDYNRALVASIRQGKMGAGLQKYIGEGSEVEQIMRLGLAQTPEQKRRVGGIELGEIAEKLGGSLDNLSEAQLASRATDREKDLADLASEGTLSALAKPGAWAARLLGSDTARVALSRGGVSQGDVSSFMKKGGDEIRDVIRDLGDQSTDPERRAKVRERARAKLQTMGAEDRFGAKDRQVIEAMLRDTDPSKPEGSKGIVESLAGIDRAQQRGALEAQIAQRGRRMQKSMGDRYERMTEMTAAAGEGTATRKMGDILQGLATGTIGADDIRGKMTELRELAAQDPEAARKLEALVGEAQGGEIARTALRGGLSQKADVDALVKKGRRGQGVDVLNQAVSELTGKSVSTQDIESIRAGGERAQKVRERILEGTEGKTKETLGRLLGGVEAKEGGREEVSKAVGEIKDIRTRIAGAGPLEAKKKLEESSAFEQLGRKGSSQGMHDELTKISGLLQQIKDNGIKVGTDNKKALPEGQHGPPQP